jgi:hypothetical protein
MAIVKQLGEAEKLETVFGLAEDEASFEAVEAPATLDPRLADPTFCPLNPRGRNHVDWRSKRDGKHRCYYCCRVREAQ